MRFTGTCVLVALLVSGTLSAQGAAKPTATQPAAKTPAKPAAKPTGTPGAGPVVSVETEKGTFEFETYPNEAPKTVKHVLALVQKRFYNGQRVHRVEDKFVVQMGDPQSRDVTKKARWGFGGSGTPIGAGEPSKLRTHVRGAVGIAYAGDASQADSQFYITLRATPQLDGAYTVFGKIVSGMDVVEKLAIGDRIIRVTVKGEK
jgi:cyclophilin family peptidyl-prolyl cis-trans isomerase